MVSPMRRRQARDGGSIDQPTSWPWVDATVRSAPASLSGAPSRASGAAAPNHTVSMSRERTRSRAREKASGVGSSSVVGWRTTSKGCAASYSSLPRQREA